MSIHGKPVKIETFDENMMPLIRDSDENLKLYDLKTKKWYTLNKDTFPP
jgi:hypothetical protein